MFFIIIICISVEVVKERCYYNAIHIYIVAVVL